MNRLQPPSRRATISDVADKARVSRSTVSRVFSRPDNISAETIAHVLRVAEQLGYQPNPTARALSTGRHRNIAVFVPDIANPFFPPLIAEIQNTAEAADYCVFLCNSGEMAARELKMTERLIAQVEGLILVSPRMAATRIKTLGARHPLVLVNRDIPGIPRILIDSAQGTREAVQHLASLGHRHVVYISGPAASWSNAERRKAVQQTTTSLGLQLSVIHSAAPTFAAGRELAASVAQGKASAILAFDDLLAQGLMAGFNALDIQVPLHFSVIGCDDVLGAATWPALTSVSNQSAQAGRLAFDLLLNRLDGKKTGSARRRVETQLVIRDSTGPLNRSQTLELQRFTHSPNL